MVPGLQGPEVSVANVSSPHSFIMWTYLIKPQGQVTFLVTLHGMTDKKEALNPSLTLKPRM